MLKHNSVKSLLLTCLFMTCFLFTFLSILDRYTEMSYSFGGSLWVSVFTGVCTSAFLYWWESRHESDEDEVAAGE